MNLLWLGRYTTRALETIELALGVVRHTALGSSSPKAWEGLFGTLPRPQEALSWLLWILIGTEDPPGLRFSLNKAKEDAICLRGLLGERGVVFINTALEETVGLKDFSILTGLPRVISPILGLLADAQKKLDKEGAWMLSIGESLEALDIRLRIKDLEGSLRAALRVNEILRVGTVWVPPIEELDLKDADRVYGAIEHAL